MTSLEELFSLRGKVALITGGARGMGRMITEGLVNAGAKVYITSRKADIAELAARQVSDDDRCIALAADLSSPEGAVALAAELKSREEKLHVLVNNSGKTWGATLETFPDRGWASVMAVNVQAPFTLVRELSGLLRESGTDEDPARIINIGSVAGKRVEKLQAYSYAASKAAVHQLSRELAAELANQKVTVNTIIPGYFPTEMTAHIRNDESGLENMLSRIPLGRLGKAEDIAGASIFLCSRAGAYITGGEIVIDGGLTGCN